MFWSKSTASLRMIAFPVLVLGVAVCALWVGASNNSTSASTTRTAVPSATFAGTGVGPIPDNNPGSPLNISFNVTGVGGSPTNVEVSIAGGAPTHTWVGDITAVLIAPDGTSFTVFGRTGATSSTSFGDSSDFNAGPYVFGDAYNSPPSGGWWQEATARGTAEAMTAGSYRTTQLGGAGTPNPAPATLMNPAFAAVTANGTWTLRMSDNASGDTGGIAAATLTLEGGVVEPSDAPNDINGDGKSDFVIVRSNIPSFAGTSGEDHQGRNKVRTMRNMPRKNGVSATSTWWVADSTNGNSLGVTNLGDEFDFYLTNDYDGDGKDDLTVWTPGASGVAGFHILLSTTSTVSNRLYGQDGDDPTIGGDWDGDGKDDLAVFRDSAGTFFWSDETTPTSVNYLPWGTSGDVAFSMDYDGDGKADAAIQRDVAGSGQFWIRRSSDNGVYVVNYGLSSDFVVPGDYDGDGRDDICVSRNVDLGSGLRKYFWILESDGGGNPASPYQWGIPGDYITQGDFDGDGTTDIAVWRPNADPAQNFFYVRKSSDAGLLQFEWGAQGDYPVNNWNVH